MGLRLAWIRTQLSPQVLYLCVRLYHHEHDYEFHAYTATYHMVAYGAYGQLCSLLLNLLPWPRTAIGEVERRLDSFSLDLMLAVHFATRAFAEGVTALERTKLRAGRDVLW